jgi:hypothetical protein
MRRQIGDLGRWSQTLQLLKWVLAEAEEGAKVWVSLVVGGVSVL